MCKQGLEKVDFEIPTHSKKLRTNKRINKALRKLESYNLSGSFYYFKSSYLLFQNVLLFSFAHLSSSCPLFYIYSYALHNECNFEKLYILSIILFCCHQIIFNLLLHPLLSIVESAISKTLQSKNILPGFNLVEVIINK